MPAADNTPMLATAYDADGDPREWVLHDLTGWQAVLVRAFLHSIYGRLAVEILGGEGDVVFFGAPEAPRYLL